MKILKYILWVQLVTCVIFTIISFLNAFMIVQLVPSINAYKHKLIEEKREFAEDNKYKIIGLTPKEFAIISNNMAREALNLSERLVFVFFIAFIVTLIEIIILNYQMKKAGYNQSGSGNLAPLNTRP